MAYNKNAPTGCADSNDLHIKSFASGIANMFACSAQHYAWLAYRHQMPSVTIDLLELRIEPAEFDIERNRILASMCQTTLLRNAKQLAPPSAVVSAVLSTSALIQIPNIEQNHQEIWVCEACKKGKNQLIALNC